MKRNAKIAVKPSMSQTEGHRRTFAAAFKMSAGALFTLLGTLGLAASDYVVPLEDVVTTDSFSYISFVQKDRSAPFKQEPKSSKEWRRGTLQLSGTNFVPISYLWNGADTLHLDLNRNEDLTDDPGAQYKAARNFSSGSYVYCTFTNVSLPLGTNLAAKPLVANLSLNERGGRWLNVSGAMRSYRAGRLDIDGKSWELGIAGHLDTKRSETLICRSWNERYAGFYINEKDPTTFRRPEKIFLSGRLFKVSVELGPDGEAATLKLAEQPAKLGELQITGERITRLVLKGKDCAAVLEDPGKSVKVPIAKYDSYSVQLGSAEKKALRERPQGDAPITVSASAPATLKAGGPLANTVRAKQRGPIIQLDYELRAADGAEYELPRSHVAPRFTIYEGTRKVASGAFEYG